MTTRLFFSPFSLALATLALSACSVPITTGLGAPDPDPAPPPAAVGAGGRLQVSSEPNPTKDEKIQRADTLTQLATTAARTGNADQAIEFHEQALALREQAYGKSHQQVAETLTYLGASYYAQQRYDDAEKAFVRALEIRKVENGPEDRITGLTMNNLAFFYAGQQRFDEAKPLFDESVRIIQASPDTTNAEKARALDNYAAMLLDAGDTEEANKVQAQAAKLRTERKRLDDIIKMTK